MAQRTLGWVYSGQMPLHGDRADWILVGLGSGLIRGRKDDSRNGVKEVLHTLYHLATWSSQFWASTSSLPQECLPVWGRTPIHPSKPRSKSTSQESPASLPSILYTFPPQYGSTSLRQDVDGCPPPPEALSSGAHNFHSWNLTISLVSTLRQRLGRRKRGL